MAITKTNINVQQGPVNNSPGIIGNIHNKPNTNPTAPAKKVVKLHKNYNDALLYAKHIIMPTGVIDTVYYKGKDNTILCLLIVGNIPGNPPVVFNSIAENNNIVDDKIDNIIDKLDDVLDIKGEIEWDEHDQHETQNPSTPQQPTTPDTDDIIIEDFDSSDNTSTGSTEIEEIIVDFSNSENITNTTDSSDTDENTTNNEDNITDNNSDSSDTESSDTDIVWEEFS